jgi:hypothetical protein
MPAMSPKLSANNLPIIYRFFRIIYRFAQGGSPRTRAQANGDAGGIGLRCSLKRKNVKNRRVWLNQQDKSAGSAHGFARLIPVASARGLIMPSNHWTHPQNRLWSAKSLTISHRRRINLFQRKGGRFPKIGIWALKSLLKRWNCRLRGGPKTAQCARGNDFCRAVTNLKALN